MKRYNEIEVQLASDLMKANAFLVCPEVMHTPPEMIDTMDPRQRAQGRRWLCPPPGPPSRLRLDEGRVARRSEVLFF